ncbi:Bug family tripartite tricarboxylate transporter substrate binding protein [Pseudorhodoferax soli]|nr:tripartite tricarboxylate transporter substrate binding protein [Pseudorhodoferax soli]
MNKILKAFVAAAVAVAGLSSAVAQDGARAVTLYVPYGAGGTSDVMARILAAKMQTILPRPVIVDNKPGAGGRLAVGLIKNMQADGSAVLVGLPAPITVAPHLYAGKLNYDMDKDYVAVAKVVKTGFSVAVPASSKIQTFQDLVAMAKKNPNKLNYGTAGVGTIPHFVGHLIAKSAGIEWTMVPFKGGSGMTTDLIAGHIDVAIDLVPDHVEQAKSGKIRVLAVVGQHRAAALPDVATLTELGVPGIELENWQGLFVPKKTPAATVIELQQAVEKAVADPAVKQQLARVGLEVAYQDAAAFTGFVKADADRWSAIVRDSKISVD